jgi:hypothetical protein
MEILCPKCSGSNPMPDDRAPPWCKWCGANIPDPSVDGDYSHVASPQHAQFVAVESKANRGAARFLHACTPLPLSRNDCRLYRIYVINTDLLIFQIGIGSVLHGQILSRVRLEPEAKPRVCQRMPHPEEGYERAQEEFEMQFADRIASLDSANEEALYLQATSGHGSLLLEGANITRIRIGPPSFWYSYLCWMEHSGVLKIWHTRGKSTFVFATAKDIREAALALPAAFGDKVELNIGWGPGRR